MGLRGLPHDGRRRMATVAVAGVAVCALVAANSCGSGRDIAQGQLWAASAEAYLSAWSAASGVGFTNAAPFYASDAHVDMRELNHFQGSGRPAVLQNERDSVQARPRFMYGGWDQADEGRGGTSTEPVYLSREGAVAAFFDPQLEWHVADVLAVTSRGVVEESVALVLGGWGFTPFRVGLRMGLDTSIVARHPEAWASGDPDRVGDLYADGAVLRDSIAGITVNGAAAIAALGGVTADQGGLPGAALRAFSDNTDASFINGKSQFVLLLDVGDEGSCPGPVAVVLDLDEQGQITYEERYHRIDALRRCLPADDRPTGWWEQVRIPATPNIGLTGWVSAPIHDIAVWNGDPRIDPIVDWARQRFAYAALPPPQPTSVTFMPPANGDRWDAWGFLTGSDAPDLGLPFTADEACPDGPCRWPTWVRAATLHEFAHLWLAPPDYPGRPSFEVPWQRVTTFLATHELTWYDPDLPWGEQGFERAAEIIAWGLMDQPYRVDPRLGSLTCEQLATDFQTLTYALPDPRACAEPTGGSGGA